MLNRKAAGFPVRRRKVNCIINGNFKSGGQACPLHI
jgi:hypothetical protein